MDKDIKEKESRHVWEFVQTLFGPVIYLGFFGIIYLASSLACALSRGNASTVTFSQAALNLVMIVTMLVALALLTWHTANGFRLFPKQREDPEDFFLRFVSLSLSSLSAVALLWTALPALLVPLKC